MKRMRWLLLVGIFAALSGCGETMPPISGTVTDLVSGQPIEDVEVVVVYLGGGKGSDGHYYGRCAANRITKTDKNGHFHVDGFYLKSASPKTRYSVLLYKDGYREGSPGRYDEPTIDKRMTANQDVYEYDEFYQKKRDYSGVKKGWDSIEAFQKTILTPHYYLGSTILGSDNDHQILFYGCSEKGRDDPGLNYFARKFILRWLDTAPSEYLRRDYRNPCETTMGYVLMHPDFYGELFATELRGNNLERLCPSLAQKLEEKLGKPSRTDNEN